MANYDNIISDLEDIKKQMSALTKTVIPELEEKINANAGGNSGEEWQVLYDCTSTDAALNYGFTTGIRGGAGIIADFPDLHNYNFVRVSFVANGNFNQFFFDISKHNNGIRILVTLSYTLTALIGMALNFAEVNGKFILQFLRCLKVDFYTNRYPTFTILTSDTYIYISKIEAK